MDSPKLSLDDIEHSPRSHGERKIDIGLELLANPKKQVSSQDNDEINLDKKFYQLSFGQKKKLQLLLLMLVNKPVWILDDPFNGLDKQSIKKITTLISKKAENKGIILLSSHQDIEINKHKTVNLK